MAAWTKGWLVAIVTGVALIAAGGSVLGLAVAAQEHAPQPGPAQAGSIGPAVISSEGSGGPAASQACSAGYCGAVPGPPEEK